MTIKMTDDQIYEFLVNFPKTLGKLEDILNEDYIMLCIQCFLNKNETLLGENLTTLENIKKVQSRLKIRLKKELIKYAFEAYKKFVVIDDISMSERVSKERINDFFDDILNEFISEFIEESSNQKIEASL